jgi:hypothetical protein
MTGPPVSLEVGVSAPHIGAHRAGKRSGVVLTGPTPSRLTPAHLAVQPAPVMNTVKCGPNFAFMIKSLRKNGDRNFPHGSALICITWIRFGKFDPDRDTMKLAKNYIFYNDSDPELFKRIFRTYIIMF